MDSFQRRTGITLRTDSYKMDPAEDDDLPSTKLYDARIGVLRHDSRTLHVWTRTIDRFCVD